MTLAPRLLRMCLVCGLACAFFFQQGEIDLLSALSELTILTASRCLHGDDVRENLFEEVARLFHDLDEGMTPLSVFLPHAPVPAHFRRDKVGLTGGICRASLACLPFFG